jgi:hypothetical protein
MCMCDVSPFLPLPFAISSYIACCQRHLAFDLTLHSIDFKKALWSDLNLDMIDGFYIRQNTRYAIILIYAEDHLSILPVSTM